MADKFYPIESYSEERRLPEELAAIKSSITNHPETLNHCFKYKAEGTLDGQDAIVLDITVSVPSRSPFKVKETERIAIKYSTDHRPEFKAYALRRDFPLLPHINVQKEGTPSNLCLFDTPQLDKTYNESFVGFLFRVKHWLDRAASGELHLDEQGIEPFIMDVAGYVEINKNIEETLHDPLFKYELSYVEHIPQEPRERRGYLLVHRGKINGEANTVYRPVIPIVTDPYPDQIISHIPSDYLQLESLLREKLHIDLMKEIDTFILNLFQKKMAGKYFYQPPLLIIVIPRVDSTNKVIGHELIGFLLPIELGELGRRFGSVKYIHENRTFHFTGGNKRNEKNLKKIVPKSSGGPHWSDSQAAALRLNRQIIITPPSCPLSIPGHAQGCLAGFRDIPRSGCGRPGWSVPSRSCRSRSSSQLPSSVPFRLGNH